MAKSNIDRQTLLDELSERFSPPEIPVDAVTAKQLQARIHKPYAVCHNILERQVEQGILLKIKDGRTCYYYRNPNAIVLQGELLGIRE